MPDEDGAGFDIDAAVRHELATQLSAMAGALPDRINADPERVEQGLARLVLTVIEVVRKVLEHQAVRRMDGGDLSPEEVERLGLTLLKLDERLQQLKGAFGLTDEDLQIDLGPLGRLR
ncbi:MAG TPA: gas vesicle protein K [Gemmatimonadaceae bacterium]|nr:gas vesicle protein K [Gemmatimonadaceae bacterium]